MMLQFLAFKALATLLSFLTFKPLYADDAEEHDVAALSYGERQENGTLSFLAAQDLTLSKPTELAEIADSFAATVQGLQEKEPEYAVSFVVPAANIIDEREIENLTANKNIGDKVRSVIAFFGAKIFQQKYVLPPVRVGLMLSLKAATFMMLPKQENADAAFPLIYSGLVTAGFQVFGTQWGKFIGFLKEKKIGVLRMHYVADLGMQIFLFGTRYVIEYFSGIADPNVSLLKIATIVANSILSMFKQADFDAALDDMRKDAARKGQEKEAIQRLDRVRAFSAPILSFPEEAIQGDGASTGVSWFLIGSYLSIKMTQLARKAQKAPGKFFEKLVTIEKKAFSVIKFVDRKTFRLLKDECNVVTIARSFPELKKVAPQILAPRQEPN